MAGKRGLILGVANNRSIAWGIAKAAHAQGSHAVNLGKSPADEQIRVVPNQAKSRDPAELEIRFIDQDSRIRGCSQNLFYGFHADGRPGGIIRIGN